MAGYAYDKLRVLIVDDNAHMRRLLQAVLTAFGVKLIAEADSVEDGWRKLREFGPDVAFIDWMLPGDDGVHLVRRIRNAPDTPNAFLPVIMVTGHSSLERVRAARDAGITEFLAKPVSAQMIQQRLFAVIEQPRPYVRTATFFGPDRRRVRKDTYDGPERRAESGAAAA